jgi:hypothetical protein
MRSHQFQLAIDVGRRARSAASRVSNSLFPRWRQRTFRRHLGRFIVALQQVPQVEASRLSPEDISTLNAVIDDVVAEAEAFMADRHDATTKEIEQDRFVVAEIYQLRSIVESLTRRVSANPELMDVGWTVRTQSGRLPRA